jgi:hypothetical protein
MRPVQGALIAFALSALAWPAAAAEISRVASSGDRNDLFDLDLSVRWERFQERATITRENVPDALRFDRTQNALVARVAVGLWKDLELHAEMPYVLADDRSWHFGIVGGRPTGGVAPFSSIENNDIAANGQACASSPCALFPVSPEQTVYHGGRVGDLVVGLAWGIFNDRRDDTKPSWVIGTDVTFPTAAAYDPAQDRGTGWSSPYGLPAKPGPFGEKVWKFDAYTVLSRRIGAIDPYVKAHATTMLRSSRTYSNCDNAAAMTSPSLPVKQMNDEAVANCASWGDDAGAQLPWIAGLTVGTELVPYENRYESQRVSVDVRLFADYTSSQRFYNELTDATGKLHMTDGYLTMGGLAGLYLRASKNLSLQATASLATRTAHYLTGESLGRDGSWPSAGDVAADPTAMNPNFDWRYDAPGRRFRISEVSVFQLAFAGVLQF